MMKNNFPESHDIYLCEICQGDDFQMVFNGHDKLLEIPGEFHEKKCKSCELYQVFPKLNIDEMARYYPENYLCYLEAIEDEKNIFTRFNRYLAQAKRCRQVIRRTQKIGSILDIGCATGIFLNEMKKRNWDCHGIEPDKNAASYARARFGLDVFCGTLEDAKLPADSFDVITMWDVLEHVPNLESTIAEINRLLKPGGAIIATLPNAKSVERYLFGEYWVGWEVPRHYRTFTPETITQFLTNSNFSAVEIFSFTGRHGAFMLSLQFWLKNKKMFSAIKRLIEFSLGSLVFRLISMPFFIILELFNRSTVMSFYAQVGK